MILKAHIPSKILYLLSILFVLSVLAPASFAEKSQDPKSSVAVVDQAAEGTVVHVTVKNFSRTSQTVYVVVEATAGGMKVRGYTPVVVFAGGTADAVVGFADTVEGVGSVGIIESGTPQ